MYSNRKQVARTTTLNRRSHLNKHVIVLIVTIVLIVIMCSLFGNFMSSAQDSNSVDGDTYYTSIIIESGDTLWTIAEEYMTDDYDSIPEYVSALKKMNGLKSDDIQAGLPLVVSYIK